MILTLIAFLVVLTLLVFVHELGHFVAAKKAGLRVHEFGFGFPPRLFGIRKGETVYSINAIPLGGFVKIEGEDGGSSSDPKSFASRPAWIRAIILLAGVIMNMLFAAVLFGVGFGIGLPQSLSDDAVPHARIQNAAITVTGVDSNSPASTAGLATLDEITSYNDQPISSVAALQEKVSETRGVTSKITIKRGSEEKTFEITPRTADVKDQGPLGIELSKTGTVSYPWYWAIWYGAKTSVTSFGLIATSIYQLVHDAFVQGHVNGEAFTGPVGIAVLTGQFAHQGILYLVWFTAFLSVNLAFINVIPFPALDGGRLLFVIIEKIRGGKKVKQETENLTHLIGFGILLLLVLVITFKDVVHFKESFVHLWQRIVKIF
jgi:regulator of sigma E protease